MILSVLWVAYGVAILVRTLNDRKRQRGAYAEVSR